MKAIIENPLQVYNCNNTTFKLTLLQFGRIIQDITESRNEKELRLKLKISKELGQTSNFEFGFGSSHVWVKQINPIYNKLNDERIIFAEF